MGTMTVRENLLFSAALRLPSSISFKEKEERVTQIISELGLSKVADSKVSTWRSGQGKPAPEFKILAHVLGMYYGRNAGLDPAQCRVTFADSL